MASDGGGRPRGGAENSIAVRNGGSNDDFRGELACAVAGEERKVHSVVLGRRDPLDGSEHHVGNAAGGCWVRCMRKRGSQGAPRVPGGKERS